MSTILPTVQHITTPPLTYCPVYFFPPTHTFFTSCLPSTAHHTSSYILPVLLLPTSSYIPHIRLTPAAHHTLPYIMSILLLPTWHNPLHPFTICCPPHLPKHTAYSRNCCPPPHIYCPSCHCHHNSSYILPILLPTPPPYTYLRSPAAHLPIHTAQPTTTHHTSPYTYCQLYNYSPHLPIHNAHTTAHHTSPYIPPTLPLPTTPSHTHCPPYHCPSHLPTHTAHLFYCCLPPVLHCAALRCSGPWTHTMVAVGQSPASGTAVSHMALSTRQAGPGQRLKGRERGV